MSPSRGSALLLAAALALAAAQPSPAAPLPLPEAPLRLVIPDAAAFDAALTGDFRRFLTGAPRAGDPVAAAWRQSRVGTKLEDQWRRLGRDLPWTWTQLQRLQPRSLGLALLEVGHLEAVLVVDTPLAKLPLALPAGRPRTQAGASYTLVARGGFETGGDKDRRMGLAWARLGSQLILATSERAMQLALAQAQAGKGLEAPLPGLAAMELDLDALRKDRYFRREFPFPAGPETGRIQVALRRSGNQLVEVRTGRNDPRGGAWTFAPPGFAAAGWEGDGQGFWTAFRHGLLEPVPEPPDLPGRALGPLPEPRAQGDRYTADLTVPLARTGAPGEEADLGPWKALLAKAPVPAWGYWVTADGVRRLVFPWPEALDAEFLEACRATEQRRAGRATVVRAGAIQEIRVGPGLPALALARAGTLLWAGPSAEALRALPALQADPGLVRWARLDLGAVRAERERWERAEGPARPEAVRPLSDQVLGLLGWIPGIRTLSVERRRTPAGWEEQVLFGSGGP